MAGVAIKAQPESKKKAVVVPPPIVEEEEDEHEEIKECNKEVAVVVYKPQLMCVTRIKSLPVVVSFVDVASSVYNKLRSCSCITHCLCKSAEKTAQSALYVAESLYYCSLLQCPIRTFDTAVCLGLDFVETAVPSVKLPPEEMYSNTKGYVLDVSRRIGQYPWDIINNVKQFGTNKMTDVQTATTHAKNVVGDVLRASPKGDTPHTSQEEARNHWKSEWKLNEILPLLKNMSVLLSITFQYLPPGLYEGKNKQGKGEDCTDLKLEFEMLIKSDWTCDCCKNQETIPQLRNIFLNETSSRTSSCSSLSTMSSSDDDDTPLIQLLDG